MDIFRNLLGFGVIMGLVTAINGNLILVGLFAMLALIGVMGKVAEKIPCQLPSKPVSQLLTNSPLLN